MLNTTQYFKQITKDLPRSLEQTASQALVKRESKYFLDNIGKVKSIDDFMKNTRLFSYAMKAFGLEDLTYAKALVKKALTEGVEDEKSFANRFVDGRLKDLVGVFNFARRGEYTTTFAETQQGTVDRYVRQTLEEDTGQQNEGVRLALYFQRKAPEITNAYQILADKALFSVVQKALDIPAGASAQDIDKLAKLIEKKMPIADLKNPKKLQAMLQKFTVKYELANPSSPPAIPSMIGTAPSLGVSLSVLTALQNLKIGGR